MKYLTLKDWTQIGFFVLFSMMGVLCCLTQNWVAAIAMFYIANKII